MKTRLILLVLLSAICVAGLSQEKMKKVTITGTVSDISGQPVTNAIVLVDGVKTNILTNVKGEYRVRVSPGAESIGILSFANGMIGDVIDGRKEINFKFNSSALNPELPGDEAVNTGYNSIKKKDLTTDIERIDGRDKKFKSYSSIFEMIQRECSGVSIRGSNVIIQDSRNLAGSVPALYVVDGVYVNDISQISPRSVESIEILKGTSAAIYGSRGYGGAVVIKTKTKE